MNNLGREFSVPQEKVQNGEFWVPATPEKPDLGGEKNHMGQESWQELIGFCSGILQEEINDGLSVGFNQTVGACPNHGTRYSSAPQEFRPNSLVQEVGTINRVVGRNNWESNRFDGTPVENGRRTNSYLHNLGGGAHLQKVNSLAELMSMSIPAAHSQVGSNDWKGCNPESVVVQQNCMLGANQGGGDCSLPQMPKGRLSVPYQLSYNLNLPPRSEAGESSSAATASPFQLRPMTPDQRKQLNNNQSFQIPPLLIDSISNQNKNKQGDVLPPHPELLVTEHTLDASAAILTPPTGKQILDSRNDGEIDLNKTPPQKTPKRRKHRPKVIVEGKAKRAPKAATPQKSTPNGNPTTKRKYVRKKGIATSANQTTDAAHEVEVSILESQAKSCKRALNFDLENGVEKRSKGGEFDYQGHDNGVSNRSVDLNLDPCNTEWCTEWNGKSSSAVKEVHQNIYKKEKETESLYNFIHSASKIPSQESTPTAPMAPPTTFKDHTLNVIARCLNMQNNNMSQNGGPGTYGQAQHCISGGLAQLVAQANTIVQNRDGQRQPKHQTRPQIPEHFVDYCERNESYSTGQLMQPLIGSDLWSPGVSNTGHYNSKIRKLLQNGLESGMSNKVNDKIHGPSSSLPSGNTIVGTCSKENESTRNKSFHAQIYGLHLSGRVPYSGTQGTSSPINSTNEANSNASHWYMNYTYSGHKFQKQASLNAEQMEHMTSHSLAIVPTTSSLTKLSEERKFTQGNDIIDTPASLSAKTQVAGQKLSNKKFSMDKVSRKDTKHLHSKKVKGSWDHKRNLLSVDYITDRLNDLQLNNNGKEIHRDEHSALVPYRGEGTLVPYEAFDPIKRRKPRPKVDLDPETNRLWNLLMGKEGSENAETVDDNKQKWWEDERKVFRGRVDSFIARMHLVQGDRRFSKWKGSVVDSVIGVFLTQNVSDHLSSSAFMCLAAKYPKKTTISETGCRNRENPLAQPEIVVTFPDGTTDDCRIIREPAYDDSCVTSIELSESGAENITPGRTSFPNNHMRRAEESVISSQSSPESIIFQASEDIRSSSGSNSEAEDQITGGSFRTNHDPLNIFERSEKNLIFQQYLFPEMGCPFLEKRPTIDDQQPKNLVYMQNSGLGRGKNAYSDPFTTNIPHNETPFLSPSSSWQNLPAGPQKWKVDAVALLGKEGISSLSSTEFEIRNGKGIQHAHDKAGSESSLTAQQTGRSKPQQSTTNQQIPNKHLGQQSVLPAVSNSRNDQHGVNYRQGKMQKNFQPENYISKNSIRPFEALNEHMTDIREQSGNRTLEPSEMKKVPANDRKRKAEKEKAEPFNWDILRKQVQSNAGTRERSKNAMDSLDYEALRNADVREISDTIKERGMNNMLAERMKDFLNRLVRDHGAIDLEWLRDVEPDKAKDYLLSIRGLGLKSVECVRLLTLHHLAFPVDTNVGRIAVRLGWVPLQPLPESLQLHLLELYPVLESIQKYLWPRLCMLDQETLYELHYQLITFGKVFCTKRDPNCNACPMRGECRHFASAFASARLTLPGPEEKRVVSSDAPTNYSTSCGFNTYPMSLPPVEDNIGRGTELRRNCEPTGTSCIESSSIVINPMPLPPAEDNVGRGTQYTRNSEPIIEEPSTPESSVEVSERDIEDAFYEDPDEIPVIKLNIKEFTNNLQTFMQEKLDLQEGDMSKALVALNPKVASIPVPKLKHISRLRTEHQVYELPDSHPLLQGMDRREPDDPSPYLLALWTPGETEDSVQPPESKCTSHEGGPCNGKTCFSCNSRREAEAQTVRGTILIPCRTAMRGSFPLNGTYFQVNEVFADHESSMNPIDVPRSQIWNLPRRTVFFGTSVTSIFKGLSTEGIQHCFWKGFVCVRGFDQKTRAPRPLRPRLHLSASKIAKQKE